MHTYRNVMAVAGDRGGGEAERTKVHLTSMERGGKVGNMTMNLCCGLHWKDPKAG